MRKGQARLRLSFSLPKTSALGEENEANYCSFRRSHTPPVRLSAAMPMYRTMPASPVLGLSMVLSSVVEPEEERRLRITVSFWVISLVAPASL